MKRIYDWDARHVLRNYTVADLRALKGLRKLTQTTANSVEEAAAARDAGIDLIMGNAQNTKAVREGAPDMFFTAALGLPDYPTETDVLRAAFAAMKDGADSIYTARGPHVVEMLAREDIPVMCHLGLVPRKSTWNGGLRAIGKPTEEALELWAAFRRMEDAGAFSVEAEVICADILTEISKRTSLVTSSLGSGDGADIIYLFQSDICGEAIDRPRHARAFGDLNSLNKLVAAERRKALSTFREAVQAGEYPSRQERISTGASNREEFLRAISGGPFSGK
jgi:3-methyl-2-oxobutanoate hydroxymethyltransferase